MRQLLLVALFLLIPSIAYSQAGNTLTLTGTGAPSGGCAEAIMRYNRLDTNEVYGCRNNAWFLIGPGAAGAASWSSLTDPTGNFSLAMAAYTSLFTFNAATGASVMFRLTDTLNNTGTGYLFQVDTASGSGVKPVRFAAGGTSNGVEISTAGVLSAIGSGGITATTGDSATSFFSSGTVEAARLPNLNTIATGLTASRCVQTDGSALLASLSTDCVANSITLTAGAGLSGGGDLSANRSFATASSETDFLASGALTCGAATQGRAQVHTTPLQYCDNAATPALQYAAYGSSTGVATSATALAADPAGCTAGGLNFTNDINTAGTSTCADVRTASATQTGIAELATTAEVAAGTDTGRTSTPSGIAPTIQSGSYLACSDAGASDTYVCTMTPTLTAYTTGMGVLFKANTANTGAATLNVDSLGAKTIAKLGGGITTALADNDLRAGQWTVLVYDGTNFQMQGQLGNAAAAASGSSLLNYQQDIAALTGDSTDQTVYTYTMPGNTIAANQCVRITARWNHSTGTTSTTYKIFFGATEILSQAHSSTTPQRYTAIVCNDSGVTNAQQASDFFNAIQSTLQAPQALTTPAEDTTANVEIKLTFNVATPDAVTGHFFMVEAVK